MKTGTPPARPMDALSPVAPTPPRFTGDHLVPLSATARVGLTLGPPLGFALILIITALAAGPGTAGFVASMAAGTFVAGGKLIILAGAIEHSPVGPWALAALIVYIDIATAMIVLGGLHHLRRSFGAGPRVAAARESGWQVIQRHPWMYHAAWLSLAAFVAIPFQGTGALVGAAIGRLLGLSRRSIVAATGSGSLFGSSVLAFAGNLLGDRISAIIERPVIGLILVAAVAAVTILVTYWMLGQSNRSGRGTTLD